MPNAYVLLNNNGALTEVTPGGSPVLIYTVPAIEAAIVKHIRVVNTDVVTDRTFQLWHNEAAAPAANLDEDVIVPVVTLDAGGWGEFEGTINMEAGDTMYVEADIANVITIYMYGLEIS